MKIVFPAQQCIREEIGSERECETVRCVLDQVDGIADVQIEFVLSGLHDESDTRFERVCNEGTKEQPGRHERKVPRLRCGEREDDDNG